MFWQKNKKSSPLEVMYKWNAELISGFFESGIQVISNKSTISYNVVISGVKRSITNDESSIRVYGHTPIRIGEDYKLIYLQSQIDFFSREELTKMDRESSPYGHMILNGIYINGAAVATLDTRIYLTEKSLLKVEEIFKQHELAKTIPVFNIRVKIPDDFDITTITEQNYCDKGYDIDRFWMDGTTPFDKRLLSNSLIYKNDLN